MASENQVAVTFLPANRTFTYELGRLPYGGDGQPGSLLDVAVHFGFALEHACGGHCACTTCHVVVKQGEALLSEITDEEADKLDTAADLTLHSRLACQTRVVKAGEVVVEVPRWNRNL
jgi:2Fe-2S ferredoxin